MHSGQYAYEGRRIRRRDMRQIWIVRLNAALSAFDIKYSVFIAKLKEAKLNSTAKCWPTFPSPILSPSNQLLTLFSLPSKI